MTTTTVHRPVTDRQLAFIKVLRNDRVLSPEVASAADIIISNAFKLTSTQASTMIDTLVKLPYKPKAAAPGVAAGAVATALAKLPNASYALRFEGIAEFIPSVPTNGNDTLFIEVKTYKGRTYMRRLSGAPGAFNRTRLRDIDVVAIASFIEQDAVAAAKLFSDLYSVCAKCHAELTDEVSRRLGLGPICRKGFNL